MRKLQIPGSHATHAPLATLRTLPDAQPTHTAVPRLTYSPARQGSQRAPPPATTLSGAHSAHPYVVVWKLGPYCGKALHGAHVVPDVAFCICPTWHC